jgi:hypothetical protein
MAVKPLQSAYKAIRIPLAPGLSCRSAFAPISSGKTTAHVEGFQGFAQPPAFFHKIPTATSTHLPPLM